MTDKDYVPTPISPGTSSPSTITKNFYVLCVIFFFEFSAFQGLANLESSLNCEGGLGVLSLSLTYLSLMLSSFFVPSFMMDKLGPKWTIFWSLFGYGIYTAANYYPTYYTLLPASVIMGAAGAPLLTAQAAYVTTCGYAMAERNKEASNDGEYNPEILVSKYFGIFFFFFEVTQISGNFISAAVLSLGGNSTLVFPNSTLDDETRIRIDEECGASTNSNGTEVCPEPPGDSEKFILISVYLLLTAVAIVLAFLFLDNIKIRTEQKEMGPIQLVTSTWNHFRYNRKQQLLVLLTMYSGFKQAFLAADLTEGFIGCALGTEWIGIILMAYGLVDCVMSWFSGEMGAKLGGRFGRGYFLGIAFGCDFLLMTCLLLWRPYPTSVVPFFWVASLYGFSDAIFQTQLYTLYGVLFNSCTDAGFANFRFWEALGFTIAYGYQKILDTNIKLYIMLSIILGAAICYTICEYMVSQELITLGEITNTSDDHKVEVVEKVDFNRTRGQSFLHKSRSNTVKSDGCPKVVVKGVDNDSASIKE